MRMNHIQLAVSDVAANRAFFETYFGLRCLVDRGKALAVMTDDSGFTFVLNHFKTASEVTYPDDINAMHIGLMQDSPEKVDEIHAKLKAGGLDPEPPRKFHGAWTFYLKAPGGFFVEVGHQYHWDDGGPSA